MSDGIGPPKPKTEADTSLAPIDHTHRANDDWWRPLREAAPRIIRSLTAIATHTVVGGAILVSIAALHKLTGSLGIESEVIKQLFLGADVCVIGVFIIASASETWKAMRD